MLDLKGTISQAIHEKNYSNSSAKNIQLLIEEIRIDNKTKQELQGHLIKAVREESTTMSKDTIKWICKIYAALENADKNDQKNEVFFSPGDDCRNAIVHALRHAIHSVQICVFTISDNLIAEEILHCKKRRVQVKIITDDNKSFDLGSDIKRLDEQGIAVKMDTSPNHMHHKFAIIDNSKLITGSYNWTRSAYTKNQGEHPNILRCSSNR